MTNTTINIRASGALREALEARARLDSTSVSETARTILENALMGERPLGDRIKHLRGTGRVERPLTPLQQDIYDRNNRE